MGSTKEPIAKQEHCPVIGHLVSISGTRVTLSGAGPSEVARKNCSNIEGCLSKYQNLDRVAGCLLHTL